ncbi:hypothetical protein MIND_00357100 [Mycena indigotica]|uniref:SAM domain-containing protein n=1 Tax=Mycena indigotica TaxID=2126181 RepID=A0A8H6T5M8_9AGAR|nr:uncharacterized protein MIND_00357100 [Mycena indigotica]KAF7309850.1 hypothetical protein MIND_00357100 [Mycena indigotica]
MSTETMMTTAASPPSSSFTFPTPSSRPSSPTKSDAGSISHTHIRTYSNSSQAGDLKPNAHPYPIKTTSTAALARSNSISASPASAKHHYVPVPPSPGNDRTNDKGSGGRRGEYRGHRYSRSFSSSEDIYSAPNGNGSTSSLQGPRALPIPPNVSNNSIAALNAANAPPKQSPKRWTPEELAAHLGSAVSAEAGEWAAKRGVGGRAFIKMGDDDLAALGAPPSLRPAARALRQEVLDYRLQTGSPVSSASGSERGSPTRIEYGTYEVEEPEDDEDTPSKRPHIKPSASPHIQASASPFFSQPSPTRDSPGGRFRNGRVQGMVRSFESSGSESEGSVSPERERGSGFRTVNRNGDFGGEGLATMRPLPVRPDGVIGQGGLLIPDDTGATVKGPGNSRAPMDASAALSLSEEELTVEQLLARETTNGSHSMNGNGLAIGTWGRKKGRRSKKAFEDLNGFALIEQQSRPLPQPRKPHPSATSSGGVHAWEAETEESGTGLARSTMKWVPNSTPNAESVFAPVDQVPTTPSKTTNQAVEDAAARGRARGAEIRALLAKSDEEREELKLLVEGFKRRLEEVERKVDDMEAKSKVASETESVTQVQPSMSRFDPRKLLMRFSSADNTKPRPEDIGPKTIAGIPTYLLLVSLGMCAVVFRVLVRRGLGIAGKKV